MKIKVDVKEFDAVIAKLKTEELEPIKKTVARRIAIAAKNEVKECTPVDSGHLRRHWYLSKTKPEGKGYSTKLYNNVEYAPYVESGHRTRNGGWVEGQYFMRDGVKNAVTDKAIERETQWTLNEKLKTLLKGK